MGGVFATRALLVAYLAAGLYLSPKVQGPVAGGARPDAAPTLTRTQFARLAQIDAGRDPVDPADRDVAALVAAGYVEWNDEGLSIDVLPRGSRPLAAAHAAAGVSDP